MTSFKMKFSGVTILQGVEFSIFPIDFEWALQQCSATALPVTIGLTFSYTFSLCIVSKTYVKSARLTSDLSFISYSAFGTCVVCEAWCLYDVTS